MDDQKSTTSKSDAQIVGILKNGGGGTVTPKHTDTSTDSADSAATADGLYGGHSDKLSAGLERLNAAVSRRKSLTPSITALETASELNGNHTDGFNGRYDDDGDDDENGDDDEDGQTDTDDDDDNCDAELHDAKHSAEDLVSKAQRLWWWK